MKQWFFEKRLLVILAGILVVAMPLLGLAVFVNFTVTAALEERVIRENESYSIIAAHNIQTNLKGLISSGKTFATRPYLLKALKRREYHEVQTHIANLVDNIQDIERAFITTPGGVQVANYPFTADTVGRDFSARDWYRGVSKNWEPYVSEFYLRTAKPRRYLFAVAIPMKSREKVIAILVLQPKNDFIEKALYSINLGQGHIHVLDKKGALIYQQAAVIDRIIDYSNIPLVQKLLKGKDGVEKVMDMDGNEPVFSAYYPVLEFGGGVIVDKPVDVVLEPVRKITFWLYSVTAFMLFLGGFFAYRGAELLVETQRLSRRLQQDELIEKANSDVLALMNRPWTSLEEVCNTALNKLQEHTSLEMGVLHLHQDGKLAPTAAVGVPTPARGSDLASECLRQKKTLRLRDIPRDSYLRMDTGAGALLPRELIAVPLFYKDACIGALEFGCVHGFRDADIKIFENLAPQLAIGIDNIKNHLMVQELSLERLRANEELQGMNEEFQVMNEELQTQQRELSEANRSLEEVSRTKSDFLANMSHELRTPLNSIIGFSEVLQDGLYGPLNEKQREYVGNIDNSGRHLLELINDILDLSKVESGKMELEPSLLSVKNVINASLTMFKEKAVKHRITLDLDVESDADRDVEADERKFKQIMYNLLSNAVKFTPDGGSVRVSARLIADCGMRNAEFEALKSQSKFQNPKSAIQISVADTGIGIKQEDLPKLFKEFTQLESVYTKGHEGTGLGLALTKRLIELHGGAIRVESKIASGSKFIFTLPVRQRRQLCEQAQSHRVRQRSATPAGDLTRALIIDDDPKTRDLVSAALAADTYEVVAAENGAAGLEAARIKTPGVIVLDLVMPGLSGFEVIERLRSDDKTGAVPIIVLTAMELSPADKKRLDDEACSLIEKGSVTKNAFAAMIKRAVQGQKPPRFL